jgi:hypothetical protein
MCRIERFEEQPRVAIDPPVTVHLPVDVEDGAVAIHVANLDSVPAQAIDTIVLATPWARDSHLMRL